MSVLIIEELPFGRIRDIEVKLFKLKNKNEFELNLISFGATIQSIKVKDKNNVLTDVSLGFDNIEDYRPNIYFGCTVGRVANRISKAQFELNDLTYNLDKNNGENCLHGGFQGFSQKNWEYSLIKNGVKFTYFSPDNDCGFPGKVLVEAIYIMDTEENKITIQYNAQAFGHATPVNITNHAYFNLAGKESSEKIYNHEVKLNANEYLDFNTVDVTVTGKINSVQNTKYDFTQFTKLSNRIKQEGFWPDEGYDNYFILNEQGNHLKQAAVVRSPKNGIVLELKTNQLGIQFYTGNFLLVKNNGHYSIHQGFCLETHNYPNSVNMNHFPTCILEPGEQYSNTNVLSFLIE